jgi:hypothetical protein
MVNPSRNLLAIAITVDEGEPYLHYAAFHDTQAAEQWIEGRRAEAKKMKVDRFTHKLLDLDRLQQGVDCRAEEV